MQDKNARGANGSGAAVVVAGAALLVLAPLPDLFGLGGRSGFGRGQTLVAFVGFLLVAAGLLLRSRHGRRWLRPAQKLLVDLYRLAAFSLFNLFLLIAGAEIVGELVDRQAPLPAPETFGGFYAAQPWARQYWREFERIEKRIVYNPYTVWRSDTFLGETLRVDDRGVRRTLAASPAPAAGADADVETTFAFGGSALWGLGAPDDATIPAFLQAELNRDREVPARIENLGERGHVATQSLIRLLLELQAGRIPDRVIFYHGFNDVAVALTGGVGSHFGAAQIANRLEKPLSTWLSGTRALKLLQPILPARRAPIELRSAAELRQLARAIVDNYLGTYRLLGGFARQHDFEVFCFWQPVLKLSSDRRAAENRSARPYELDRLLDATYAEIGRRAGQLERLDSLAGALDAGDEMAWVDQVHLTPRGNRIVAQAIAEAIRRRSADTATSPAD